MIENFLRDGIARLAATAPGEVKPGSVSGWLKDLFDTGYGTFWVGIAFLLFMGVVIWKARNKMVGALDSRAERIRRDIDEAQRLRDEAQALLADYQRKQREALGDAQAMVKQAEEESARLRAKAEAELDASLKRREQRALDRIAQAEAQALAEVRNLAADLAVAATRQLMIQSIDGAKADALVDAAIAELPRRLQ